MKILTDSAADLPAEELAALGVTVAPLLIQFPEGEVRADEILPDDFYSRLQKMFPRIPTTSQPSAGVFKNLYQKIAETGEEILSIHISSGLSGTIQSARTAAEQLGSEAKITLFDSLTLSGAERFQVLAAAKAAALGWPVEKIIERLESIRAHSEIAYTLETLEYLARGGRIGRVQALAGSLLRLKPVIRVEKEDGKYSTAGKERTLPKAMRAIVDHLVKTYDRHTPLWFSVMHGQFAEQAEELSKMLRESLNVGKLEVLRISPVLGVHTGPGVVGVAAVPMREMEFLD